MSPGRIMEVDDQFMEFFGFEQPEGYHVPFTRRQDPHAKFANGTRVRKAWEDVDGDLHGKGECGVVLGSISPDTGKDVVYFVEWDRSPKMPTGIAETKLEAALDV